MRPFLSSIKMSNNFRLTIEYDGTNYCGWQRQNEEPTIQAEIERVLSLITRQNITITGSGRTDAGVHALGQTASFRCNTRLSPQIVLKAMNSLLPQDIVIRDCSVADDRFHARYDASAKIYHYNILNNPIPSAVGRNYSWHIKKKLNVNKMRQALLFLVGTHDFKAFENSGSPRSDSIRTIYSAQILEYENGRLTVVLEGSGFLRQMVRNIVGTLVRIGIEKMMPQDMKRILLSKDRNQASTTAPAHGLFLVEVRYGGETYQHHD